MLSGIGFQELGSEKTLSVEKVNERYRFFMLNRTNEQRMHVDIYGKEAQMLAMLLTEPDTGKEELVKTILSLVKRTKWEVQNDQKMLGALEEVSRYAALADDIEKLCEEYLKEAKK